MLSNAIAFGVTAALLPVVFRFLSRSEVGARGCLAYGARPRIFAVVMAVVPLASIVALAAVHPPKEDEQAAFAGLVTFFPSIALPLVIEFLFVRIRYDEDGIHVRSPWSRRRTIRWSDVRAVRWRKTLKWLDVTDGSRVVHVSPWLAGLSSFAEECERRIAAQALAADTEARAVLVLMKRSRAGQLVWSNVPPSTLVSVLD